MRLRNAETMLWLIRGRLYPVDPVIGTALEAYVNGAPLPSAVSARLWRLVREAEAADQAVPSPASPR